MRGTGWAGSGVRQKVLLEQTLGLGLARLGVYKKSSGQCPHSPNLGTRQGSGLGGM